MSGIGRGSVGAAPEHGVPEPAASEPAAPEPAASEPAAPEYAAPALDRGLDVLELLADADGPLSQADIASGVGRSSSQLFRVLSTLERRGFVFRDPKSGLYLLSTRLFDLAHRHEPLRSLVAAASGPMRRLAEDAQSSCNLSVYEADRMRVVAQVESPGDFGFRVRVGALFPLRETATGLVQLAFPNSVVAASAVLAGEQLRAELAAIARDGSLVRPDTLQPGITDIVFPVLDEAGGALAVLTVPYVATSFSVRPPELVRQRASVAAREIAAHLHVSCPVEAI